MVPAAAIAAVFAGGAANIGLGVIIGTIVVNLAISAILGKVLAPDAPTDGRDAKGLQTVIRSNIAPRRVAYGECVTGGPYTVIETIGTNNQILNMVITLTGHPIEDVLGVYLDDEYIYIGGNTNGTTNDDTNDLDSNYWVDSGKFGTGEAAQHVKIIKNLGWGFADNTYVTDETATIPTNDRERASLISSELTTVWTLPTVGSRDSGTGLYGTGYKLTNCAHILVSLKYNPDVWAGFPQIKFHIKGKKLYNPEQDSNRVADGADSAGTHDLNDPDTWEYSEDWTLACLDYLLNTDYGLAAKTTGTLTEIDWAAMIQSYTESSALITNGLPSPDTANVSTYTINGMFEVSSTPISIMESLLTSGSGSLIYAQGEYKLRPGVYRAPNSSNDIINEDMMVGGMRIQTHTPRAEVFNKASGVYVDVGYDRSSTPSNTNKPLFEPSDFEIVDPLDSSGLNPYEVIDGEEIIKEFDFPFTVHEYEAQRLARIQLERVRQGLTVQFEGNLKVLKYSVGDNVYLEILNDASYANESFFNRLGLDDTVQNRPDSPGTPYYKQFKIVNMEYTENFTIGVTLLEESEEIYDWNEGDANTVDYALESELIFDDPTGEVLKPSWVLNDSPNEPVTEIVSWPNLSTILRWRAPERGSLVNALDRAAIGSYEIQYGIVTNPSAASASRVDNWIDGGTTLSNDADVLQGPVSLENLFVDDITVFDFRVRSLTYQGRASNWAYYSEDEGTDFTPTAPASAEVSTPVAGVNTFTYDNQFTTFSASTGTNVGEWTLFNNGDYDVLPSEAVRLYLNIKDANNVDITDFMSTVRNGDTITLYISSTRWYKWKLDNANSKALTRRTNSEFFSPVVSGDNITFSTDLGDLVDYKDTNPTEAGPLTSQQIEIRFERDAVAPDLNKQLDTQFALGGTGGYFTEFWSFAGALSTSPDVGQLVDGLGEDGNVAMEIFLEGRSGSSTAVINSNFWFPNINNQLIEMSMKYQSISGSDPAGVLYRTCNFLLAGSDIPDSYNDPTPQATAHVYLPATGTGNWNTVSKILKFPTSHKRFLKLRIEILMLDDLDIDLIIDSINLKYIKSLNRMDTILISNTASINYAESPNHEVDLAPASANVTLDIISTLETDESAELNVKVIQDSTARTITWQKNGIASGIYWAGGTQPTLTATSGAIDLFTFKTYDGGSTWYGSAIQDLQ